MRLKLPYYLSCVLLLFSISVCAQITDDFTDSNFTSSPTWTGNDTDFIVNASQQMQLSSSGTSASYLSIANTQLLYGCEWNFWIHLNFSPSTSNYARVYLISDQQNLSGNLNGYYLQFGEALANDRVELFRKSGTTSTSVCRGTTPIATAFTLRIKITRDSMGLWKLFIDPTGGTNYVQEASGTDNTFTNTSFFGLYCKYTSTNSTKFFFDDFYIYSPPDTTPALLDSIKVISKNQVDAYFSKTLSTASAQTLANYSVSNNIGVPSSAVLDTINPSLVHLTFPNNFMNGQTYTLTVTGVQDLAGNTTLNATKTFFYFHPLANDIVINEIMADINPAPNSLPAYEYLELYNRTNFPVSLKGWKLSDATSTATLPDICILPDSFYVLTSTSAASLFGNSLSVAGVTSFPSLNDTGDEMILRDENGNIISVIFYRPDWYNNPMKQNGGWALEQIDPNNPCSGKSNWKASADNAGGTPGRKNSVNASAPDAAPPKLSHATVISSNSIQLFFDEYMDSTTLINISAYTIDNVIGNPVSADPVEPDYTSVLLTFSSSLNADTIYSVTVNGVQDCAGNTIASGSTAQFAIAQPAEPNDIVINEVMFDPKDNGVEWIEIYNRSAKVIDLKEIYVCSQDNYGNLTDINQVATSGYLIFPQKYIVLSKDASSIKKQYSTPNTEGFIDMTSIPSLNNDSDYVVLANISQTVIDKLHYHSEWHLPLLNDTKGISLERINFENLTQDENNWHSAAESVGGATPAYKNSQYTTGESGTEVTLIPEVFSPDNDGYNDVLSINYTFDTPGMIGNVSVYDSRGRLTKTLVRNELLAASGTFFWDGITDEKEKSRIGIYIIYFEAFDTKGKVKKCKKTCVVAGKL
ncbi:MAG: lamin tail domain-containing protein [Bacteroidetes bacterium]|nr:lamin tail domain-containing protein [Bacteroidota bacterium]